MRQINQALVVLVKYNSELINKAFQERLDRYKEIHCWRFVSDERVAKIYIIYSFIGNLDPVVHSCSDFQTFVLLDKLKKAACEYCSTIQEHLKVVANFKYKTSGCHTS